MNEIDDIRVIYIAGYGRSGSTLLSMLLNIVPEVYNLGELDNLYRTDFDSLPDYWKTVRMSTTEGNGVDISKIRSSSLRWFVKRRKGNILFRQLWLPVLNDFGRIHNAKIVVDASKSTYLTFSRPFYYKRNGMNVKVIHLVRDLNGVVDSFTNGRNTSSSKKLQAAKKGGAFRAIFNWLVVNVLTTLVYRTKFNEDSFYYLSYNKLMSDYENELKKLFNFLELDPVTTLFDDEIKLETDHSFSGNRVRLNRKIKIKPYPHNKIGGFQGFLIRLSSWIHKFIESVYSF